MCQYAGGKHEKGKQERVRCLKIGRHKYIIGNAVFRQLLENGACTCTYTQK